MKKSLWIVLFLLLTLILLFFLPDGVFNSFVTNNIEISGDGEMAMNSYDTAVILIKLGVSAAIAIILTILIRRILRSLVRS
ncbi:hypothetical protein [Serratia entomophila]|jgi:ABC-type antimicrobial peptide transport system permease subunit|uniref:Uncharacterized protein n=1 Tax=Serratia entomophila TaxID=42906 RepID=A0ABY5CL35_9GAMM|nr:hypothetical protein [Serratia entomophila]UIW16391.1 hypothetical protein KHA73_13120 [Serratia entomophila]USU98948.1 hypothetical protein KFQ06_12770 [Serratia entomophila]CAI0781121.1 Uncharacterised protein [Serratia entomophila]CAI1612046.1 Uncharacterised protein [Serratia entomophila]